MVTEPVRERETFKYYSTLTTGATANDSGQPTSSSELTSCDDPVLTALAQAGAFQTGTDRSLISLFDSNYQYIIAEATPFSRLLPSVKSSDCHKPLWLCGTSIPRSHGVCELSLLGKNISAEEAKGLPLTLADDLVIDPRFCSKPYCQPGTLCRFYAAVPIRSPRGINIGVYCVINETPGKVWTDENTQTLRDISHTIMGHLEQKRLGDLFRRNERMNRGLGSFIEGKSELSSWQSNPSAPDYVEKSTFDSNLNPIQQSLEPEQYGIANDAIETDASTMATSADLHAPSEQSIEAPPSKRYSRHIKGLSESKDSMLDSEGPAGIFPKAANIIRESTEVEGCLFVDATMEAYRSSSQANAGVQPMGLFSTASSGEDSSDNSPKEQSLQLCKVLGHSTCDRPSISEGGLKQHGTALPDKFLAKLLRRYPKGKVFNFGADSLLQSSDSSEDDGSFSSSEFTEKLSLSPDGQDNISQASTRNKSLKEPWARHREGIVLLQAFPGARSIAFTPMWDPRKDRWYAGCFIYTNDIARSFTVEGELSYLSAFGMLTMAEILRVNDVQVDKAKSDILGSLSHELRSPLHGIILSAELLGDSGLSVFQRDAGHTIELCSRTLLDTIDHLLDYSKINRFARKGSKSKAGSGPQPIAVVDDSGQFGEKSLMCETRLDRLIEEVVESVFAGYTFQYLSATQPPIGQAGSTDRDAKASHHSDPMQTIVQFAPMPAADTGVRLSQEFGDVSVILSIDARQNWSYFAQVGAVRRIIMNIFGNALKYTTRGTITVSLTQERRSNRRGREERVVKFAVQDTGKGINPDFLQHDLFRPFSQEDALTPGTGLGLSLVKQIVSQLQGEVSIQSEVGVGTTASVILPLEQAPQSPERPIIGSEEDQAFKDQVRDLKGLRIGFSLSSYNRDGNVWHWQKSVPDICREWLTMEVVSNTPGTNTADILLWSYDELPSLSKDIRALSKAPNVVVCPNALVAYRQSKVFEAANYGAIFEFISQPLGPRKLARALFHAYTRWMNMPDSPTSSYVLPVSVKRPEGPNRKLSSFTITNTSRPTMVRASSYSYNAPSSTTDDDTTSVFSDVKDETLANQTTPDESPPFERPDPFAKFLLVDDNHINLKVLATYMKKLGVEYDTAMNGQEAVDLFCLPHSTYTCVLMDISMPVMDGFEATRCIRAYEGQNHVPIIALSGLASEEAHREAIGCGMDLLLTKPVKLKALGSLLESMGILNL